MLRFKKGLSALFIAVMMFSLSACNNSLGLFINAKAGDTYKYHTLTSISSNTEIKDQKNTSKQDSTTDFKLTVDNVDSEGNLTVSYKYDKVKVEVDSNGTKQTLDSSSSNSSDTASAMYKSIIGKGFTTKMTKLGEITEVKGVDELLDSMIESMGYGNDENMKTYMEQTKENMKASFGDKAIKSVIQQSTKIFPDKNVKVGDSWEIGNTINSIVEIDTKTTYTLDKVEDKIAYLSIKSEYKTDNSKPSDYMGMEMTTDMTGTMSGTIKVDIRNCLLSEGDLTQTMKGTMNIKVPAAQEGKQTETMSIPMDSNAKITYSTTKM